MTTFFKSDTHHGFVKRFIYMRHLEAFIAKTQQVSPTYQAIIYDAFAGAGCYSADSPVGIKDYGSPIIALYVVIRFFIRKNKIKYKPVSSADMPEFKDKIKHIKKDIQMPEHEKDVILNFSEANKRNCLKLVNNIIIALVTYDIKYKRSSNSDGVITYQSIDADFPFCINVACTKFTHVKPPKVNSKRRLLTFIDPFGYSQIPMQHVQGFIGKHREALINFMSSYVNRFKKQEKYEADICELYGFSDEEKSERLAELRFGSEKDDGIDRCLKTYEKELKKRAESDLILTFAIRSKRNIRLYHLTFITNHIEGFKAMKEAMNRGSQDADSLSMSDYRVEQNGKLLSLVNDQNDKVLAATIFEEFRGQKKVKITDVEDYILFNTPFVWRKKPLQILQKEPENNPRLTIVEDKHGNPPRRRYTFPGDKWLLTFRTQSVHEKCLHLLHELTLK